MESNPILEELWRVKDKLAAEAGYDVDRFLKGLRQWEIEHPFSGKVAYSVEELHHMVLEEKEKRAETSGFILKDKPASN